MPSDPAATLEPPASLYSDTGVADAPAPEITAAERKLRLRRLDSEVERVKSEKPQRSTAGLFKQACSTDLLFLIDTTYSMQPYLDAAKNQVKGIVSELKKTFLNQSVIRVAVVGYKDHADNPHIQMCDFTESTEDVYRFLDSLTARGGGDAPEDVLGGIKQALAASWRQQTRCLFHIADAPPHGRGLHDLKASHDDYYEPGSEPHKLLYEPLIRQMALLRINYALLRITSYTDRMALAFSDVYAANRAEVKLLPANAYQAESQSATATAASGLRGGRATSEVQWEELQLGTSYADIHHLIVRTATSSVTRTAGRLSKALSAGSSGSRNSSASRGSSGSRSSMGTTGAKQMSSINALAAIVEDDRSTIGPGSIREKSATTADESPTWDEEPAWDDDVERVPLDKSPPQWNQLGWFDEVLEVDGYCPDVVVHDFNTLNDMMASDDNIKLGVAEFTIHTRTTPFAQGGLRVACYSRAAASTSRFVVKRFLGEERGLAHMAEDMRIQALCKAFALEFNGLLKTEHPIDFVVSMCLQNKHRRTTGLEADKACLAFEPFLDGEYVKYNSNTFWDHNETPDSPAKQAAQAFSHFTFERSWGHMLIIDLQGVGYTLTDPAIHTRDPDRFKLSGTNFNEEGFKFFFALHECNDVCRALQLQSTGAQLMEGRLIFRRQWPTMDPTVCCSSKLCRRIIRLASAHATPNFPGYHWCDECWPQLEASRTRWICTGPGPTHEFDVSRFFCESQGKPVPRRCLEHMERDTTVSAAARVGGGLWSKMKSANRKKFVSGSAW